jgi:hypothetical protein
MSTFNLELEFNVTLKIPIIAPLHNLVVWLKPWPTEDLTCATDMKMKRASVRTTEMAAKFLNWHNS